jgi:hypothetical protein
MQTRDTFKVRHFLCQSCRATTERLQWNYDPVPVCGCGQAMIEGIERRDTLQIITDDVPGGFTVENGFPTPQKFYSKSAHRSALAERGLRIADRGEFRT